jgi:4'-phosphopantetheinyl transferase
VALVALAWKREVGVDVEQVRPLPGAVALAERYCTPEVATAIRAAPEDRRDAAFLAEFGGDPPCWSLR